MQHSFFSGAIVAALSLILVSCGGGGAREVAVRQQEEGYYAEVQDVAPKFLCDAAENGNAREARFLLENGADPNALCHTSGLYQKSACTVFAVGLMITAPLVGNCWQPDKPPMFFAVENGHADVAELLLENGADAWYLPTAVEDGRTEVVRVLLKYGAKSDMRILLSAVKRNPEIVRMLLSHGAQPCKECIIQAVRNNNHETVQLLLDCGANPGAGDIKGVRNAWDFARDNPVILGMLDRWLEAAKAGTWEKNCPQKTEI